ncbi:MAG: Wzz/FepE/Etk N-terminal domain-containing protein, partial [Elusimicrobia bacterium]|nr:Wzz/FepE/Etk N-terminal domain-containing protein [Elusimicrobiota bacterium]
MKDIAQKTEQDLAYYADIVLRRRWIVLTTWLSTFLITALITFNTEPLYQAYSLVAIEKEKGGEKIVYNGGPMVEVGNDDYYQTQYKLFKSNSLLAEVYKAINLSQTADFAAPDGLKKLQEAVTITPVPRSRLVYVNAQSHDPKLAA